MAKKEEKKRISESVEEVDQLLDDMAVVSRQMREGKRLYSEEEIQEKVSDAADELLVNLTDEDMYDWFFGNGEESEEEDGEGGDTPEHGGDDTPQGDGGAGTDTDTGQDNQPGD